jgi:hypothetical protein
MFAAINTLVLMTSALVPAETPKARPQPRKWEYKVVDVEVGSFLSDKERTKKIVDGMNKLGDEGWEFVAFGIRAPVPQGSEHQLDTYRRPRAQADRDRLRGDDAVEAPGW